METLNIIIPERMTGNRMDVALSEMLPNYSRSKITAWIKSGDALIDEKTFKPKDKVNGPQLVRLSLNKKQNNDWSAENIPLNVVFEDEDIIVINKACVVSKSEIKKSFSSNKSILPKLKRIT